MKHVVYILTRSDGKLYIGTTNIKRYKNRMAQHRSSARFRGFTFEHTIVAESDNADEIYQRETELIREHNTLAPNGLNLTWSGRGKHHNSTNFTTRGRTFSEEAKRKMSESAKRRCREHPRTGWVHSEETKRNWSLKRRGIVWGWGRMKGKTLDDIRAESHLRDTDA